MFQKLARLFVIKTKFDAFLIIYAIACGAIERGLHFVDTYPGVPGWLMFTLCPMVVFMAGARILDSVERERAERY